MLDTNAVVLWGCIGALIPDSIRIVKERFAPTGSPYLKSGKFYFALSLLVALGGLAAFVGEAQQIKTALACGYAAPEFLTKLLSKPNAEQQDRGDRQFELRRWWAR
jgi:hypothetical protein